MTELKIGIIGVGNMGFSIVKGLIKTKIPSNIFATDVYFNDIESLEKSGVIWMKKNLELIKNSNVVIICVKPNQLKGLLEEMGPFIDEKILVISIAAGVKLNFYQNYIKTTRIVRVMPNINCLSLSSASAYCMLQELESDEEIVKKIFSTVGTIYKVTEDLLDAVTGLSGSGPAFVFSFIDSLIEGGVLSGLSRELSTSLAIQTVLGSTQMLIDTKKSPSSLKDLVTSPGGTTIHGLKELEKGNFKYSVMSAVYSATNRSKELNSKL